VDVQRSAGRQSFAYDVLGQCVSRVTNGKAQNYYYDLEGRLLFETASDHTVTARYIYNGQRLIAVDIPGTGSLFYHFDALGNCLWLTDESGKPVAAYAYQPFGLYQSRVDRGVNNPFTFVGEYGVRDEGDGLYLMRHRHYEAHLGRFVQPDPIGVAGGSNLYAYSGQNPTTFIDPSGLIGPVVVALGALALVGVAAAGYLIDAGSTAFHSYISKKKVSDNAVARMGDNSAQGRYAQDMALKLNPTGMHTGPVVEVLGIAKTVGTTVAENLPIVEGVGAVQKVVVEGVKTAAFDTVNKTLDTVSNQVVLHNASGTQTLRPPSARKHGCPTK
jgi:RHS repeat-associated protein